MVFMGSNDNPRGAFYALRASDGSLVWTFYGAYPHGTSFTDVNGTTFDAGDTWTTKVTPNDTPNNCYLTGGAAPWQQGAIDNELKMIYVPFGNVRSCNGSQNGEGRPGDNLFGSSVVAIDYKTGAYKWHFQAVKHDIWDMDNALTPVLADIVVAGATRKVLFYGSKSAFQFTLDRATGKPVLPIEYRAVPGDTRNAPALTQPIALQSRYNKPNPINGDTLCMVHENLGSVDPKYDGVHLSKGHPNRLAPNWNGMQAQPDPANPGQLKLVFNPNSYLAPQEPFMVGPPRNGCLYDGSYENFLYIFPPSQNGGNDMTITTMSPKLNMRYVGLSYMPGAHPLQQGGNGLRMIGGYQSGAILGVDNSTGAVVWYEDLKFDLSRQHNPLVTATDLLFHTQMDGWLVGRDAATGKEAVALPDGCAEPGRHDLVRGQRRAVHRDDEHGRQPAVFARRQRPVGLGVQARRHGEVLHRYAGQPDLRVGQQRGPGPAADPELASSGGQHRGGHRPGQRDLDGALEQHRHLDGVTASIPTR